MPVVLPEITVGGASNGAQGGASAQQENLRALAEKVAERVLEMLRRELLLEQERRGRGGR